MRENFHSQYKIDLAKNRFDMMAEKLGLDSEVHELKLGSSFGGGPVAYHSIRYDFKPASVDTSQVANVDIGEGNSVTVTVPHVEGSGTAHTVYKGNKKPCQKECVLIIDHQTGEITLEKLATNIQLKKTRIEGSSKAHLHNRPHTPTEKVKDQRTAPAPSPKKRRAPTPSSSQANPSPLPSIPTQQVAELRMMDSAADKKDDPGSPSSAGSSSSSSDSDSDMDISPPRASAGPDMPSPSSFQAPMPSHKSFHSTLSQDLQLSDSGSDSD